MCYFFQVKTIAPQNLGEVPLLAPVHPILPAGQTGLWVNGVNAEAASLTDPVQMAASISASTKVETQAPKQTPTLVPAQNQAPAPESAQMAAVPDTYGSALIKAPTSVPIEVPTDLATAQSPAFALPKGLPTSSDTPSAVGEPKLSIPGLASVPIPVTPPVSFQSAAHVPATASILQPAGIRTARSVSECASLTTTQQNLESTFASSTLQQEPCVEVGIEPKHIFKFCK